MSYSGNHPRFSKRKDESYDAGQAYDKNLSSKARMHYLENDIADHKGMSRYGSDHGDSPAELTAGGKKKIMASDANPAFKKAIANSPASMYGTGQDDGMSRRSPLNNSTMYLKGMAGSMNRKGMQGDSYSVPAKKLESIQGSMGMSRKASPLNDTDHESKNRSERAAQKHMMVKHVAKNPRAKKIKDVPKKDPITGRTTQPARNTTPDGVTRKPGVILSGKKPKTKKGVSRKASPLNDMKHAEMSKKELHNHGMVKHPAKNPNAGKKSKTKKKPATEKEMQAAFDKLTTKYDSASPPKGFDRKLGDMAPSKGPSRKISAKRAAKKVAKGKGTMEYKYGGKGPDNAPGGKNNKGTYRKDRGEKTITVTKGGRTGTMTVKKKSKGREVR